MIVTCDEKMIREGEAGFRVHHCLQQEMQDRQETAAGLAELLQVDPLEFQQVLQGTLCLTPELALKLAHHWQVSGDLLLSLQKDQG